MREKGHYMMMRSAKPAPPDHPADEPFNPPVVLRCQRKPNGTPCTFETPLGTPNQNLFKHLASKRFDDHQFKADGTQGSTSRQQRLDFTQSVIPIGTFNEAIAVHAAYTGLSFQQVESLRDPALPLMRFLKKLAGPGEVMLPMKNIPCRQTISASLKTSVSTLMEQAAKMMGPCTIMYDSGTVHKTYLCIGAMSHRYSSYAVFACVDKETVPDKDKTVADPATIAATEPTLLSPRPFAVLCPTARDSMWELSLRELSSRRRNTITHLCVAVPIRLRVFFLQQLLACTESAELHAGGSRATGSRCTRLLLQRCVTTPCP